jgi:hypothetical protein
VQLAVTLINSAFFYKVYLCSTRFLQ